MGATTPPAGDHDIKVDHYALNQAQPPTSDVVAVAGPAHGKITAQGQLAGDGCYCVVNARLCGWCSS